MKVAIISNNTLDIVRARGELIESIIKSGHEVVAIGNRNISKEAIEALGAKFRYADISETSINLFEHIRYINELTNILKEEKIDVAMGYTVKPIVCGSIAAKRAKVKRIYALVAGMGYNYSINTFRNVIVRFFCSIGYRIACKIDTKVIFQNKEDREELIRKKFVKKEKTVIIDGSGVNMNKYIKTENKIESMDKLKLLSISRGINVKGIKELSLAGKIVHEKYPNVKFIHIGEIDKTYRGISDKEIEEYSKTIDFKGRVDNVYEYIKESNVVVLPSYLREGVPRSLIEALAVGRPIITTDIRGCKETVIDGENGYLVKIKDEKDLANKIILMVESSKAKIKEMSETSYKLAKERFDMEIINKKMLEIMELE